MGLRSMLLASSLVILIAAAPVQAGTIWDYLPELPGVDPSIVRIAGKGGPSCPTDDPVCTITCQLIDHDDGFVFPEADLLGADPKVILPGPGVDGGHVIVFGHWTICL